MSELNGNNTPERPKLEKLPFTIFILFIFLFANDFIFNSITPEITDIILLIIISALCLIEGIMKKKETFVASAIIGTLVIVVMVWIRYY
jgi:hypothetical protein